MEHHRMALPLGLGMQNSVGTALSHQAGSGNKGNEPLSQALALRLRNKSYGSRRLGFAIG